LIERGHYRVLLLIMLSATLLLAGCAGKKSRERITDMSPEALYKRAIELYEHKKLEGAIGMLESIEFAYSGSNRKELEPLVRMGIADATFYRGYSLDSIDAHTLYLDFVTRYGDHPLAPYAQFQAGVASLEQVNHPSKDQSQTLAAFTDLREVERRYPDSKYSFATRDMISRAQKNLVEHEFLVGKFYLDRKKYMAAVERFRNALDHYPLNTDKEKIYFYLAEGLIASDRDVEGRIYLDKLITDYPFGDYVKPARAELEKLGSGLSMEIEGSP
jgi:outer membrane protein assembly factor BamD